MRGIAIREKTGKPIRMLGAHTNLMVLKRAEKKLQKVNEDLHKVPAEIKVLRGISPICTNCKQIRDYNGYRQQVESYISQRTDTHFSHGICPKCAKNLCPDMFKDEDFGKPELEWHNNAMHPDGNSA